ncbi:XRE family transcriptional regulator [Variovorax beijingensis]|uniref:XRE family transcriptional regulator n=1 Tax=Variovorax beijingensis TaxID=2496117 RepID=A0A3P3EDT2_9BURK|nr:helix-turn-helix transcriptional regulator [Variovorax beijingensis]RRH84550.1 XRE family transcriptional regulator [Variovorax beijingensis]
MPSAAPPLAPAADRRLAAFGRRIHARRKALKVSATTAAEAAGVSRMTLHRIERGEPSVTMGAYMNALAALGLDVDVVPSTQSAPPVPIAGGVRISDYPQLRRLAWQLAPDTELTPAEAWATYERNWRHVDASALDAREQQLLDELARALGRKPLHV